MGDIEQRAACGPVGPVIREPQIVVPPDMELYMTRWLRRKLEARGIDVEVSNKEPADASYPLARPLIVVRDDGGTQTEKVTFDRTLAFNVLYGSRQDDYATMSLARLVYALVTSHGLVLATDSPVCAIDKQAGTTAPIRVDDPAEISRVYFTVEYSVAGDII